MRSTAPFAVSAAPAEAGHGMNAGAADTVRTYTEGSVPFVPNARYLESGCGLSGCINKYYEVRPSW